ncbi:hypothetical protein [Halomonas sp. NO4]|uniref:hypothetical protein n=1 Tax=Halomonas sp. NO4 TaxID=2484813 RepID=UPI0013D8A3FE|nr:hypothetical protein [Halomonas sp. NO4]
MSNAKMTFPTIWDRSAARPSVSKPFLRRCWNGVIKLAEIQCRAQARRGFLPYT